MNEWRSILITGGARDIGSHALPVHGDHEPRIVLRKPNIGSTALLSDADMIDNYATSFAVRMPGRAPGDDRPLRSIQSLCTELRLKRPPADETKAVFLARVTGRKIGESLIARPMPDFEV